MTLPFRDINVHVAADSYTFTSPSSPNAPTLIIDRPTGDVRLSEAAPFPKRVSRVSSISGILGFIRLRLGNSYPYLPSSPFLSPCSTIRTNTAQTNMP